VLDRMDHGVGLVMVLGLPVPRRVPVVVAEEVITQHTRVAQAQGHALANGRVRRRRGVSDQHHACLVTR
jgi:hypothetical protein